MAEYIGDREEGFLFETDNGKMLSPETLFRDGFKTIFKKMGRAGVRFHAFRFLLHRSPGGSPQVRPRKPQRRTDALYVGRVTMSNWRARRRCSS